MLLKPCLCNSVSRIKSAALRFRRVSKGIEYFRVPVIAMRAVIQRVRSASVEVDGKVISRIGPGLLCLIGVKDTDATADQEFLCVLVPLPPLLNNRSVPLACKTSR